MLLVVVAAIALPALLDTGGGTKDVGLTGAIARGAARRRAGTRRRCRHHAAHPPLRRRRAEANRPSATSDIDVLVVDAQRLEWRGRPTSN